MAISRRKFVQSSLLAGACMAIPSLRDFNRPKDGALAGINPFILQNPEAVFIMRTQVNMKTDSSEIRNAGLDFGRSVFCLTDDEENGIPLTHKVVIKPNLTCRSRNHPGYTIEKSMGIVTDAFFVEGIINSLRDLGFSTGQFYIREVNCPDDLADGGYTEMATRTGIDLQCIDTPAGDLSHEKIQWIDVPDGIWFKRIPYLWPVNAPDTFLLNISKFKTHSMGLTLCAKNLQGTIAMNYQAHCKSFGELMNGVDPGDLNPSANAELLDSYNRHKASGIPRWDRPGSSGGIWQETWANRCIDNNSVTLAGLHIIEGIYGRDGNFMDGPGKDGLATDYMTNYIIFGRNQYHVDNIGHYLGGHEPGNFGLFHIAKERGMSSTINPAEIPLYEWDKDEGAKRAELNSFKRYPLKTNYLRRDYNGGNEPYWHMVNESYEYGTINNEMLFTLEQNFPNPVRTTTRIIFVIPSGGHVRAEVLNSKGMLAEVLTDRQLNAGTHSISWNAVNYPSGMYFCRISFGGSIRSQKIMVIH